MEGPKIKNEVEKSLSNINHLGIREASNYFSQIQRQTNIEILEINKKHVKITSLL